MLSSQNTDYSPTSDDEESDQRSSSHGGMGGGSGNYKERRREAHTQAEQKRRDAIKKGYEDLQLLVPSCTQQDAVSSYKLSKAAILQRSIEYIQTLQQQKHRRERELQTLRKEVLALEIMKQNYEDMLKHQAVSSSGGAVGALQGALSQQQQIPPDPVVTSSTLGGVSEEYKFELFKALSDSLFQSFDASIQTDTFNQLSSCSISWLEEHCKPDNLRAIVGSILEQTKPPIT